MGKDEEIEKRLEEVMNRRKKRDKAKKKMKKEKQWEDAKKDTIKDLRNKWFWIYTLGMIIFGVLFFIIKSSTVRIICLLGFIIIQLIYNIKYEKTKNEKYLGWAYTVVFLFYLVIYTSMQVKEFNITIFSILIFGYLTIGWLTIKTFFNLKKSKPWWEVTLNYILLSGLIILLFAMIFTLTNINNQNRIIDSDSRTIVGTIEYIWFSAGNFYITNFGEIPYGWSKSISYIEIMISMIIHVLVIGRIINSLPPQPIKLISKASESSP